MTEFQGAALKLAKWPLVLTCPACGTEHSYWEPDFVCSGDPYTYQPL
jgi:hypothetical protein